ncbi:hypothetical protein [Patulibacter sp.]|uniref:hypothetical protein n=1 Tax=Patulibacter sp. TaxID=1912859 RepID=UPI0027236145|nr:hypothetical protein [Patulibacter sp.]MDO9407861.1 hypothetical protein [Patulibacter sp.]
MGPWLIALAIWIVVDVAIVVALARTSGVRSVSRLFRSSPEALRGEQRPDGGAARQEPVPALRLVSTR